MNVGCGRHARAAYCPTLGAAGPYTPEFDAKLLGFGRFGEWPSFAQRAKGRASVGPLRAARSEAARPATGAVRRTGAYCRSRRSMRGPSGISGAKAFWDSIFELAIAPTIVPEPLGRAGQKPQRPLDGDTYWVSASTQNKIRIVSSSWMT